MCSICSYALLKLHVEKRLQLHASLILIYWSSKILHHSSNCYTFSNTYGIWKYWIEYEQTDHLKQILCIGSDIVLSVGAEFTKMLKILILTQKSNRSNFHRKLWLFYVRMMFVMRQTQIDLNWFVLRILVDFLNFLILAFLLVLNNRIAWQHDLMGFKCIYPVIYGVLYQFQTNLTWSPYWF